MGALQGTRTRFLIVLCLLVGGYCMYTATVGWYRNSQLDDDRSAAEERVRELQERKNYIEGVKEYVASDAYVEQQARRQLGFGREGETVFVVTSPPIEHEPEQSGSWLERLFPR
jgi:cell division protein FtsB